MEHATASQQDLPAGVPQKWMKGPVQVAKQWKVPVLGVNLSYHSQTMLPVVWKKKNCCSQLCCSQSDGFCVAPNGDGASSLL